MKNDLVKTTTTLAVNDYGDDAGAGFENTSADDMSLPYLSVIQGISPEVDPNSPKYIASAKQGDLFNTVTKEIYPKEGVIFQPCVSRHVYVEWRPRQQGGGFVAEHEVSSPLIQNALKTQEFGKYKSPTGNDYVETYLLIGLVHRSTDLGEQANFGPEPILIPFTATKIVPFKNINYRLFGVVSASGKPPLFAHRLRIATIAEKRPKGTSYNYKLTGAVDDNIQASLIPAKLDNAPHPMLVAGRGLKNAFEGGEVKVNHSKADAAGGAATGDEDVPF